MLIVGCGDVGTRLAENAHQRGEEVLGLVRSVDSADRLRSMGVRTMAVDLDQTIGIDTCDWNHRCVYYLAPPPSTGDTDPRLTRLLSALPEVAGRRMVYISTTGVYGDCDGAWVDESRPPNPQVDRARRRLDAEQQLQAWRAAGHGEVVILRVAGIYGPGKLPLARLQKQIPMVAEKDAPWTNRIHIDDLVQVCEAAMVRGRDGEVYNVSDGTPGNMRDYFDRVADLHGLPRPPVIGLDDAGGQLSAGMLSYLSESRRLDNRKLINELGIRLRYPDLTSGLTASIAEV